MGSTQSPLTQDRAGGYPGKWPIPWDGFKLAYGNGKPRRVSARRKCLCLSFSVVDRGFGCMHVRVGSWFPFTIQVCLNGHDRLARKLDCHGIAHRDADNVFLALDDPRRTQHLVDGFVRQPHQSSAMGRCLRRGLARGMGPRTRSIERHDPATTMTWPWIRAVARASSSPLTGPVGSSPDSAQTSFSTAPSDAR